MVELIGGARAVSEGEASAAYRFGKSARWAMGYFSFWAETFPGVRFIFLFPSFFFSFFCFLFLS
jgi:hypothetical protein